MKKKALFRWKDNIELAEQIAKTGDVVKAYKVLFPQVEKPYKDLKSRMEKYPKFKQDMIQLLDAQGLSLIYGNSKLRELLEATKPMVVAGEVQMYPDYGVQTENLKTLYKLHKAIGQEQASVMVDNRSVNFNMSAEDLFKLEDIIKKMGELEKGVDYNSHVIEAVYEQDGS